MSEDQAIAMIVTILRPFKGTGEAYYHEDDGKPDRVGPDEPIRNIVKEVMKQLDIDGLHGCPLCLS